jgi:LuxR family transcriptional regulator, maltose regulon positive regulatory protein
MENLPASKLTVPTLPGWMVTRPRLDRPIARGARGPLTVLSGPPGAGKTTAVASWAAAGITRRRIAWVTVDDYDNEPGRFWSYMLAALQQSGVALPRAVPALLDKAPGSRAFLPMLAATLASLDPPLVLVLDDLHLLTALQPLEELAYLLRYAHPGLHVVVAARTDPLLPLHRHRLAGELTEIRACDLAFTVPESGLLMARHGLALPAGAVELIAGRVEGWAAGLRLAALSLDGHPDPGLFIKNLAAEENALTSYLVDEVLDAQPAAARELMLRTSIVDRVSADLAQELTGDEQAGATLSALARSGAFIEPLGHGWYRCHSLFAEVVRLKQWREFPASTPALHRKAAVWYQRKGLLPEAVAHAGRIGDWELAARIIVDELGIGELLNPPGRSPAAGLLRQMMPALRVRPEDPVQPPSLLTAAALELSDGHDRTATSLLAAAEQCLGRLAPDHEIPARLACALLRLEASGRAGDLGGVTSAAANAATLSGQLPPGLRERHPETQVRVLAGRGIAGFWSGDHVTAAAAFTAAAAAAAGSSWEQAACHGQLALIEALCGRLSRAAELVPARMTPPADDPAGLPPTAAVALALVCLERNELAASASRLNQAEAGLRAHPDRLTSAVADLVAARGALASAHGPAAAELLQRARDGWSPPSWLDHLLTVAGARASTASGEIQAALDAARRSGPGSALDAAVALARGLLAGGDAHAAREALASAAGAPPGVAGGRSQLDACLTEALLSYRLADAVRGRRYLERAMRLAEPERVRLPFVMDRSWILPALRSSPDLAAGYHRLLQSGPARRADSPGRPVTSSQPDPVIVDRLSDREREVLRFASSMLSTEEIAREMYLSVNTIKTHFKSIFRKLGATRRGEAVRRARKQGLI